MASNATMIAIPANIAELTGPVLLGHFFNWGLFGALSVQVYLYYLAFPNDRFLPTKALAISIYIFEVSQVIIATYDAFRNFGNYWGDMIELDKVGLIWFSVVVQGVIVSATSQTFYAWRIWILSGNYWIPGVIIILALTQSIAGIYDAHLARGLNSWLLVTTNLTKITPIWLGGTALCDVVVAFSMTWCLWRARSGWRQSNAIILKIVTLTVETGMVCAAVAVIQLILYLVFPQSNYHLTPALALSKLYSNSLFAVLNARVRIIGGRTGDSRDKDPSLSTTGYGRTAYNTQVNTQIKSNPSAPHTFRPFSTTVTPSGREINVSVTREMHNDDTSEDLPMKNMGQYSV